MEPKPPRTAKEAALQDAQADKLPFNPEGDKRHVIASAIRLAGEATGQSEQAAEAADEIRRGEATPDTAGHQETLDNLDKVPVDSGSQRDLSLADMILVDQAASHGFPTPPAMPAEEETSPPLGSSFDALQSPSWMAATFSTQVDTSPPQSSFPALAQFNDATTPPNVSDLVGRYDTTDPGYITQFPYDPADEPPGPKIQLLSSGASAAGASRTGESRAPITYLPFGESAAASNAISGPAEKLRVEVESSIANAQKNSVLAYLAMEPAILKAIDRAGEQDRRDAFLREASRRACL
ncbi:MAG: hypothetical protein HY288_12025 [Planctomycetia bacterium]|nr:hypothetical protein [Planctomycetia bacterium]